MGILQDILTAASVLDKNGNLTPRTSGEHVELNARSTEIEGIMRNAYAAYTRDPYYAKMAIVNQLVPSLLAPNENFTLLNTIYNTYVTEEDKLAIAAIKNSAANDLASLKKDMEKTLLRYSRNDRFVMTVANYFDMVKGLSFDNAIIEAKKLTVTFEKSTYLTEVENTELSADIAERHIFKQVTDYTFSPLRLNAVRVLSEGIPLVPKHAFLASIDGYDFIWLSQGNELHAIVDASKAAVENPEKLAESSAKIEAVIHTVACRQGNGRNSLPHRHAGDNVDDIDVCETSSSSSLASSSSSTGGIASSLSSMMTSVKDNISSSISSSSVSDFISSSASGAASSATNTVVGILSSSLLLSSSSSTGDNLVDIITPASDNSKSMIALVAGSVTAALSLAAIGLFAYKNRSAIRNYGFVNANNSVDEIELSENSQHESSPGILVDINSDNEQDENNSDENTSFTIKR